MSVSYQNDASKYIEEKYKKGRICEFVLSGFIVLEMIKLIHCYK